MDLIEIDVIGSEAPQTILDRPPHVLRLRAAPVLIHRHAELGGHDRLAAALAEGAAEKFFTQRVAVNVGRVEEIDASVERSANHRRCAISIESSVRSCYSPALLPTR